MYGIIFLNFIIILVIGIAAKLITDRIGRVDWNITWTEFLITLSVCAVVINLIVVISSYHISKNNQIAFYEFWSGWETSANVEPITCERDGRCNQEYDCDPYIVMVSYSCNCTSDKNGSHCDTCTRPETRYHSCPYVDYEYNYTVSTTLKDFDIASHRFPENPQEHRWRDGVDIPDGVIESAGIGAPEYWKIVDARIKKDSPKYATIVKEYDNYILATEKNILKQYSGEVERFKGLKLFPSISTGPSEYYTPNKCYFVGSIESQNIWSDKASYFGSALAEAKTGDFHLVLINNKTINQNPDAYAIALKAYWMDINNFGKHALPKNTLVLLLGTEDNKTLLWARAFTGMPMGNEELTAAIRNLKGEKFDPIVLLGDIKRTVSKGTVRSNGVIENIVFSQYKRVSMKAEQKYDVGNGFKYLFNEVEPTDKAKAFMIILTIILGLIGWFIALRITSERRY